MAPQLITHEIINNNITNYVEIESSDHHILFVYIYYFTEEPLDWRRIQTLVRSMPGLHKTLIIACVKQVMSKDSMDSTTSRLVSGEEKYGIDYSQWKVEELAIASEHAPFRHKNIKGVGMQLKP